MKRNQGFTLIEIMIVVLIIGMLAAIAIPSFVRARNTARANTCINNMRQIEQAKEMWAMEENMGPADDAPDWDDLEDYIRGDDPLTCPADSDEDEYDYNAIGTNVDCPVFDDNPTHELPTQ